MSATTHLFIPGPTNVPDSVRRAIDLPMEDMRAPDFPDLVVPLLDDLKKVFKTMEGRVFVFPSSGSGAWEAAVTNVLSPGDKVLMSRFGQFSHLWVDMCQRLGLDVDVIDVPWGEGVPVEEYGRRLAADTKGEIKAVFACHNETATGVCSDIAAVRKAMDTAYHPALLFVDGVSSIASVDFRMDDWGVDLAVTGSQKGLMLPAGLGILAVSPKALAMTEFAKMNRAYFDLQAMAAVNDTGYFPYTPPTTLLRGLRTSLDLLFAEGLENVFARHHRIAEGVRQGINGWGLQLCARDPKWHSDTVSAICVPEEFDANEVIKIAYYRYQMSLGAGLSQVAGKVFRIGHLGSLNEVMALSALSGVELAMRDAGIPIEFGSGVAAAQQYFSDAFVPALAKAS